MSGPDPESVSWLRFIIASMAVIGLMGLLAWGLRVVAARGWLVAGKSTGRRLKIVESLALDARRRLVIVRCDGAEHVLLLGLHQDCVVARDVGKANEGV